MITEVKVLPRGAVQRIIMGVYKPFDSFNLISIYTPGDPPLLSRFNTKILQTEGLKKGLSLCFADITPEQYENIKTKYSDMVPMNKDQGKQIIKFIDEIKNDNLPLIVHCDAGISRSGAVGTFVIDYLNMSYADFTSQNPYIHPNIHILSTLRRLAGMLYENQLILPKNFDIFS